VITGPFIPELDAESIKHSAEAAIEGDARAVLQPNPPASMPEIRQGS